MCPVAKSTESLCSLSRLAWRSKGLNSGQETPMALGRVTRKSRGGLSPAVLVSHSSLPDAPRVHPRPPWGCGPSPSPAPAPVSPTIGCRGWGSTPILRGSGPQLRALTSSGGPHAAPTSAHSWGVSLLEVLVKAAEAAPAGETRSQSQGAALCLSSLPAAGRGQ